MYVYKHSKQVTFPDLRYCVWIVCLEPKIYIRGFFLCQENLFTNYGPDSVPVMFYSDLIEQKGILL